MVVAEVEVGVERAILVGVLVLGGWLLMIQMLYVRSFVPHRWLLFLLGLTIDEFCFISF